MRYLFINLSIFVIIATALISLFFQDFLWTLVITGPIIGVGLIDFLQTTMQTTLALGVAIGLPRRRSATTQPLEEVAAFPSFVRFACWVGPCADQV